MKILDSAVRKINNISTRKKLMISYIFTVFLPVLLVGLILTDGIKNTAMEAAEKESGFNVERAKKRVADIFKVPRDIADKLYLDKNLEGILTKQYGSFDEIYDKYGSYADLEDYLRVYRKEIENIQVYTSNTSMINSGHILTLTREVEESPWYKAATGPNVVSFWDYTRIRVDFDTIEDRLCYIMPMNFTNGRNIAVIVISVNDQNLGSIFTEESYETLLVKKDGVIVAARDSKIKGRKITDLYTAANGQDVNGKVLDIRYNNQNCRLISDDVNIGNFKIVSIIPKDAILKKANQKAVLGFTIIVVSLFISMVFILFFSEILTRRLNRLSSDIHKVSQGNFDLTVKADGDDEVGQLAGDFNLMVKSIKELIHEVYEVNLQKNQLAVKQKEIELRLLSNQINPHFLFNTLETIRMEAHSSGQKQIARIIQMLGELIRRNLDGRNEPVPLNRELNLLVGYLEIQKFRFGDKLEYSLDTSDEFQDVKILPLILQPVVENAVIHGIEGKIGRGTILIQVAKISENLIITVKDNGTGMSGEKLAKVKETLDKQGGYVERGIGLRNVHQRIKLFYGEEYGLNIASGENIGTTVEILLPGGNSHAQAADS